MWLYSKTLEIKWTEKIRNGAVLTRIKETRESCRSIGTRRDKMVGHLSRLGGLMVIVMEGDVEGCIGKG